MGKTKKKFNTKVLFLAISAAVFLVIFGALFSSVTGYEAKEQELIIQLVVWSVDIVLSYTLSWLIFTWGKRRIKYINWIAWGLSIIICTILVIVITGTFELGFASMMSAIIPLGGYIIALLKKNYYRVKVKEEKENETEKSNN